MTKRDAVRYVIKQAQDRPRGLQFCEHVRDVHMIYQLTDRDGDCISVAAGADANDDVQLVIGVEGPSERVLLNHQDVAVFSMAISTAMTIFSLQ